MCERKRCSNCKHCYCTTGGVTAEVLISACDLDRHTNEIYDTSKCCENWEPREEN